MYTPNFYDLDSIQFHKIMMQEKLNFSHIDKNKSKEEIQEIKDCINITTIDTGVIKKPIHT